MLLNKSLQVSSMCQGVTFNLLVESNYGQEINIQNMNVELVAQMFKNYQSNVLFHLEGNAINLMAIFT
jgi:hypothetical protein